MKPLIFQRKFSDDAKIIKLIFFFTTTDKTCISEYVVSEHPEQKKQVNKEIKSN